MHTLKANMVSLTDRTVTSAQHDLSCYVQAGVSNNIHMKQPCTTLMHASADIYGYFEHAKENSKYRNKHNTIVQHYPQQCSSDKLNFIHA